MAEIQSVPHAPDGGLHAIPFGLWLTIVAAIISAAVLARPFLPRYDVQLTGENGSAVMIHDKWTGRVQRANYSAD